MHNLHFISVCANDAEDAIDFANSEIDIQHSIVDYFNVVGAFSLTNNEDYIDLKESWHYSLFDELGNNPVMFKQKVIDILNSNVVPLDNYVNKLNDIIVNIKNYETNLYTLSYDIQKIGKDVEGNNKIHDLAKNTKYDFQWHLLGLTNFHDDVSHIALVDFHQ